MSSIHLSPSFVTAAVLTDYNTQLNQLRQEVAAQRLELASLRLQFANFIKDEEVDAVKSTHQIQNSSKNCFRYFCCFCFFHTTETSYESKRRKRIHRTTITESGEKIVPSLFLRFVHSENQTHIERGTGADSAIETPISTPTFRLHNEQTVGNGNTNTTTTIIQPNPLSLLNTANTTTIEER